MDTDINKKIKIADAFKKHFMHFGFKKTTVDEVVADLGISKKTIYKYFDSKDDIFYFIISSKAEARRIMIEHELEVISSAAKKMETMIRINFTEFRKIHKKKSHALDDRFQYEIASMAFRESFNRLVSDIIEEGVENEEFTVCHHEMTVKYIQALITETVRALRENSLAEPEESLICTVNKILQKEL